MKLTNRSNKVIFVKHTAILPGDTAEFDSDVANVSSVRAIIERGFLEADTLPDVAPGKSADVQKMIEEARRQAFEEGRKAAEQEMKTSTSASTTTDDTGAEKKDEATAPATTTDKATTTAATTATAPSGPSGSTRRSSKPKADTSK